MEKSAESTPSNLKTNYQLKISQAKTYEKFEEICSIGDSEKVEMGGCLLLKKNEKAIAYSLGAGPCVSGVIQTKNGDMYMFHGLSYETTPEQKEIIKNASYLIVGSGEKESLDIFMSEFKDKNIKPLLPPKKGDYIFNIVFVKDKNNSNEPDLYFSFEAISDLISY